MRIKNVIFQKIFHHFLNPPSLLSSTNDKYSGNKYSPNMVLIFNSNVFHMFIEFLKFDFKRSVVENEEDSLRWSLSSPRIYSLIGSHFYPKKRQFFLSISLWQLKRDFKRQKKHMKNLWKMCFMSFNILHTCWQSTKPLWSKKTQRNHNVLKCIIVFGCFIFFIFRPPRDLIFQANT